MSDTNDNVTPIRPGQIFTPTRKDAVEAVVSMFETLLERAKNGDIIAAGVAYVDGQYHASTAWGPNGMGAKEAIAMIGATSNLNYRMNQSACEDRN